MYVYKIFGVSYRQVYLSCYLGCLHDDLVDLVPVKTLHTSLVVIEGHSGEEALSFRGCNPILHPEEWTLHVKTVGPIYIIKLVDKPVRYRSSVSHYVCAPSS